MKREQPEETLIRKIKLLKSSLQSILKRLDKVDANAREVNQKRKDDKQRAKLKSKHERYERILRLRAAGKTFDRIAEALDIIPQYAIKLHKEALQAEQDGLLRCDSSGNKIITNPEQ